MFLKEKSLDFERTHNARTYLMLDADNISHNLLGYFSLSFKEIVIGPKVSRTKTQKMDGFNKHAERIRAYLIGQLAKNFAIPNNPLTINEIFNQIYPALLQAHESVGGRVILLECEDNLKLVNLYQASWFEVLQKQDLVQMYRIFDPIEVQ